MNRLLVRWKSSPSRSTRNRELRSPMKFLFLHGWHSVPGGVKPSYLIEHGYEVLNPALDDDDFDEAVRTAQAEFDIREEHRDDSLRSRTGRITHRGPAGVRPGH